MRPRLSRRHILVVLISIYLAVMTFPCVNPCKGDFTTRPGLNCHQNKCPIFRTSQALKIEHRKMMQSKPHRSLSKGSDGLITKLEARKARIGHLGTESPASSFKSTIYMMVNKDSFNSCQATPLPPVAPSAFLKLLPYVHYLKSESHPQAKIILLLLCH